METETRTVLFVVATIIFIVAASFAGLGFLANRAIAAKAGPAFAGAPDVRLVEQRAEILLIATIALWLAASAMFAKVIPQQPGSAMKGYMRGVLVTGIAIVVTVTILNITARLLQLV
jgi:hypothetical protein